MNRNETKWLNNYPDDNEETSPSPPWLIHCLRLAADYTRFTADAAPPTTEAFRERCRQAAEAAMTLEKLRAARERVAGFPPLSLAGFINELASMAKASLSPALAWFGIAELTPLSADNATDLARLAMNIGLSFRETFAHLRIEFAAQSGSEPIYPLLARGGAGDSGGVSMEDCEEILSRVESKFTAQQWKELRRIEDEVRAVYESAEQDADDLFGGAN
jgi:hypothetical protein